MAKLKAHLGHHNLIIIIIVIMIIITTIIIGISFSLIPVSEFLFQSILTENTFLVAI